MTSQGTVFDTRDHVIVVIKYDRCRILVVDAVPLNPLIKTEILLETHIVMMILIFRLINNV